MAPAGGYPADVVILGCRPGLYGVLMNCSDFLWFLTLRRSMLTSPQCPEVIFLDIDVWAGWMQIFLLFYRYFLCPYLALTASKLLACCFVMVVLVHIPFWVLKTRPDCSPLAIDSTLEFSESVMILTKPLKFLTTLNLANFISR